MLKYLFWILVLGLFLVGCGPAPQETNYNDMIRRAVYIEHHRNNRQYMLDAVKNGIILPDMDPVAVEAAIGSPDDIKVINLNQVWIYKRGQYKKIYFEMGTVVKVK